MLRAYIHFLAVPAVLAGCWQAGVALAEPAAPGDLVIERQVGPRVAYRALPHDSYPITSSVPAFPAQPFGTAMDNLSQATDADLSAHGSMGLIGGTVMNALQSMSGSSALPGANGSGGLATSSVVGGGVAGPVMSVTGGLGTTIPNVIGQALQPLTSMTIPGAGK